MVVFVATVFALFCFEMFSDWHGWCAPNEAVQICRREWAGTLVALLAVFAGCITIYVLIGQMREARRQADYMFGLSPPSFSIFDASRVSGEPPLWNTLLVVNWNRNPLTLHKIAVTKDKVQLIATVDHVDDEKKYVLNSEYERQALNVAGWLDRSKPPSTVEFRVFLFENRDIAEGTMVVDAKARRPVTLYVTYTEAGMEDSTTTPVTSQTAIFSYQKVVEDGESAD